MNPKTGSAAFALAMALPVVERLRLTVTAENDDIAQGRPVPYEAYSLRKNQGLLELNRLLPALGRAVVAGPLREALADLNTKLEVNRRRARSHEIFYHRRQPDRQRPVDLASQQ
jgi:hypothetical protein